jgi:hypothetical protein
MAICGHPAHHMSASAETAIAGQGVVRLARAEVILVPLSDSSKEKMRFQSFSTLMILKPCFPASS